jgi:hypothetical protein
MKTLARLFSSLAIVALCFVASAAAAENDVATPGSASSLEASWRPADAAALRAETFAFLASRKASAEALAEAEKIWPADDAPSGGELLDRVVRVAALVDERAKNTIVYCGERFDRQPVPELAELADGRTPKVIAANVQLYLVRWLAQHRLYDEALQHSAGLTPADVADPASLLFYRAVAEHHLLKIESCLTTLAALMERSDELPRRHRRLAELIQADLAGVEVDSPDHIARRMDDVGRRLALGRVGQPVRQLEDGVIESLDKLIKQIEDQQQDSSSSASATPSGTPAEQSRIMGGKGEGKVDRKDVGQASGWGDLPAKLREEALQQIGKDFPAHYREVIEEYFRRLANESSE